MNKIITSFVIGTLLTGCVSTIGYNLTTGSEESIIKGTSYTYDKYQQEGWLSTEYYLADGEDTFYKSVTYKYRGLYTEDKLNFIQLYGRMRYSDWCFLEEAYNENGVKVEFYDISRDVLRGTSGYISEEFSITLSKKSLENMALNDFSFKAVGSDCDVTFTVDKKVASGFLKVMDKQLFL